MSKARRGEVWQVDFGMAAKVRPALLLTDETEQENELDVVTLVLHTTSLRGNRWEVAIPKSFLQPGALHCQQVQTVSTTKLLRFLGALSPAEMKRVSSVLAERFNL